MDPANIQNLSTESTTPVPPISNPASTVQPPTPTPPQPTPKTKWSKGVLVGSFIGAVLLIGGVGTGIYLNSQRRTAEIRSRASEKTTVVPSFQPIPTPDISIFRRENVPTAKLFDELLVKYGKTTKKLYISNPNLGIGGDVYMHFDSKENKTWVFFRVEGLKPISGKLIKSWLVSNSGDFGITSLGFVLEPPGLVVYGVYRGDRDLTLGSRVVFSYDSLESSGPGQEIVSTPIE